MQDNEFHNIWVGSNISWWKPWVQTKDFNLVTSIMGESPDHHDFERALKSTKEIVKAGWKIWTLSNNFLKYDNKSSNWELVWLGER